MQSSEVHQPPSWTKNAVKIHHFFVVQQVWIAPCSDRSDFSVLILVFASFATAYTNFHFSYIEISNLLWFQKSFMNPVLKARSNSPSPDSYTRWWIEHGKSNISENMTAFVNISRLMTNSETLVASLSKSDQAAHSLFSGYWQQMYFLSVYFFRLIIFVECAKCIQPLKKAKFSRGIFEMMQCFASFKDFLFYEIRRLRARFVGRKSIKIPLQIFSGFNLLAALKTFQRTKVFSTNTQEHHTQINILNFDKKKSWIFPRKKEATSICYVKAICFVD